MFLAEQGYRREALAVIAGLTERSLGNHTARVRRSRPVDRCVARPWRLRANLRVSHAPENKHRSTSGAPQRLVCASDARELRHDVATDRWTSPAEIREGEIGCVFDATQCRGEPIERPPKEGRAGRSDP
jgi:hypothetical protein